MAKIKRKIGIAPETLLFTGKQKVDEVIINYLRFNEANFVEEESNNQAGFKFEQEDGSVDWFDLRGIHNTAIIEQVGSAFEIHNLILSDIVDVHQRPKFDEFDNGLLIIAKAIAKDQGADKITKEHVVIYFTDQVLLSFQEDYSDLFHHVRGRVHAGKGKVRSRGTDYLAFALLDSLLDNYYTVLDDLQAEIELLEDKILEGAEGGGVKEKIHQLKKQLIFIRKQVSPFREATSRFSKSDHEYISDSTKIFIRDLYTNTVQIMDSIDSQRDVLNGLQDLYISEISFRMNQIMKVLTIITTLFVPLSFLAGLYGMNFENIPELHFKYGYYVLLSVMVLIVVGFLLWFKKKNWF